MELDESDIKFQCDWAEATREINTPFEEPSTRHRLFCFDALSTISEVTDSGSQFELDDMADEGMTKIRPPSTSAGVIAQPTVVGRVNRCNDYDKVKPEVPHWSQLAVLKENLSGPSPPSPSELLGIDVRVEKALLELTHRTNYSIMQRNGQRIYGGPPPNWIGPAPSKGCEVFVGKIPRDCFEDELVPIFERIGPIYELRLMMDFSGLNRGYLFVRYTNVQDAKTAVRELNNYPLRSSKRIGVLLSVDNRKLWINGVPKNCSAEDLKRELLKVTEGVIDVKVYPARKDSTRSRGYFYVEYECHRAAALARRRLIPGGKIYILGMEITKVDWAEPEYEVADEVMAKVTALFVRNLSPSTNDEKLFYRFNVLSEHRVEKVKKFYDYAFVHFTCREAAEMALRKSSNLIIDGSQLEVNWAKPCDKNVQNVRQHTAKQLALAHHQTSQPVLAQTFHPPFLAHRPPPINFYGCPYPPAPNNQAGPVGPGETDNELVRDYPAVRFFPPPFCFDIVINENIRRGCFNFPGPSIVPMISNGHAGFGGNNNAPSYPIEPPFPPTFPLPMPLGDGPAAWPKTFE